MTGQNEGYLVHFGIKGQKHGVRNGPPYPLSASSHSSAERAAGTKGWSAKAKKESKSHSDRGSFELTDKQREAAKKTLKVGAVAAGAALAAIGVNKIGGPTAALHKFEEAGKLAAFNIGKGLGTGVTKGLQKGSERIAETATAGITMLAMVEVADLATNGAVTQSFLRTYNDFTKKDSKINLNDLEKVRNKKGN